MKQPHITQTEVNKIERYFKHIKKWGYRPWVTVRSSHTYGQGQILNSRHTNRAHHLLSRGELNLFLKLEQLNNIVDILEQYPLPILETLTIAERLNILHPGAHKERHKHKGRIPAKTMTTDLVLVRKNGNEIYIEPYSYKYMSDIFNNPNRRKVQRTLSKLRIESEYWATQSKKLTIVTDADLDKTVTYNLKFLRECFDFPEITNCKNHSSKQARALIHEEFSKDQERTLQETLKTISIKAGLDTFSCQCIFQHSAYHGHIPIDLHQPIETYRKVALLQRG